MFTHELHAQHLLSTLNHFSQRSTRIVTATEENTSKPALGCEQEPLLKPERQDNWIPAPKWRELKFGRSMVTMTFLSNKDYPPHNHYKCTEISLKEQKLSLFFCQLGYDMSVLSSSLRRHGMPSSLTLNCILHLRCPGLREPEV